MPGKEERRKGAGFVEKHATSYSITKHVPRLAHQVLRRVTITNELLGRQNMGSENRKKKKKKKNFVLKPHTALASILLFHSLPGQRRKHVFRTQHLTDTTSPRPTGRGSWPNLEGVWYTERRAVAVKFEGRWWSVSRGLAWDVGA